MFDCSGDVLAHHDEEVSLPQAERTEMRGRRDANRDRLKRGLKDARRPAPREFVSQGSYAMRTMTQHPEKDYDIDDGVYFDENALVGERGEKMSSLQAKEMVRAAIDDGRFNTAPEVHTNCVRIHYAAGYRVDLPVYRRLTMKTSWGEESHYHELASGNWKRSDARDVTAWFEKENTNQSVDENNGRQLRRLTRQIKKFSRSHESWKSQVLSGFGITKLVTECFRGDDKREDCALYYTMRAVRDRLDLSLVVAHPVTPNEAITSGSDDTNARFLREKLSEALETLAPLFEANCTRTKALRCWDRVFSTTFFSARNASKAEARATLLKVATVAPPTSAFSFPNAPRVDNKPRGFA
jgi:hypothetical protein